MGKYTEGYESTEHSEEQYEADQHNAWMEIKCTEECVKEDWYEKAKSEGKVVGENMICPVTKEHCDDECCPVGAVCNLAGGEDMKDIGPWGEDVDMPKMATPSTSTPAIMPGSPEWDTEIINMWLNTTTDNSKIREANERIEKKATETMEKLRRSEKVEWKVAHDYMEGESGPPIPDEEWKEMRSDLQQIKVTDNPRLGPSENNPPKIDWPVYVEEVPLYKEHYDTLEEILFDVKNDLMHLTVEKLENTIKAGYYLNTKPIE